MELIKCRWRSVRGFNLVEAAIVLGIVGLVIGGIWIAAAHMHSNMRINDTAQGVFQTINNARALLPYSTYPTVVNDIVYIGPTLNAAKAYPAGYRADANMAISPYGVRIEAHQACFSYCPILGVTVRGVGDTAYKSTLTASDCIQLARRIAGLARDKADLVYIQVGTESNPTYQMLGAPIDPNAVDCPANFATLVFWFRP